MNFLEVKNYVINPDHVVCVEKEGENVTVYLSNQKAIVFRDDEARKVLEYLTGNWSLANSGAPEKRNNRLAD